MISVLMFVSSTRFLAFSLYNSADAAKLDAKTAVPVVVEAA